MVKVIGKDPKHVHQTSCKNCAAMLEYTKQEVKSATHHDYGGGSDTVYYIDCPECGKPVYSVKS